MEYLIFWIGVGLVAALLATRAFPGQGLGGVRIPGDFVIGVMGAFLSGLLFQIFFGPRYNGGAGSTIVAFVGAVVLLFILRAVLGRRLVDPEHAPAAGETTPPEG